MKIIAKIRRKLMKLCLQPVRVYCLHHVCKNFDESMEESDWMPINDFKSHVQSMQQEGVEYISLTAAYYKITNDKIRTQKYAVLTFDDGYASLKEILPWLAENHIPVTLFINGKYLDGKSFRKTPIETYLTQDELFGMTSPYVEVGSHGWEHLDVTKMDELAFAESMEKNIKILLQHPRYIPFHAYTWGRHSLTTDNLLKDKGMIPVYVDGACNYNDKRAIHRELLKV